jgi:hypothetical protein
MTVFTADGTLVGEARDLDFDPENGSLIQLRVLQGGLWGIGGMPRVIPASELRALGPQYIMVGENALAERVPALDRAPDHAAGDVSLDDDVGLLQERRAA